LQQIAYQVRSSTGATMVPRMTAFLRTVTSPHVAPKPMAPPVQPRTAAVPIDRAPVLLALLRRLDAGTGPLPPITALEERLGGDWNHDNIRRAFFTLHARADIVLWAGTRTEGRGHYVLRVRDGTRELRTEGAPEHIHV
jgi:hypothetical protein